MPVLACLRALGLGDFLTGVPALRALAGAFPDHRRVLAAPRALAPLLPLVGNVAELCHTPDLVPLDPSLRRPDVAVDLHGNGPASHDLLVALGPRRLVAFAHPATPASRDGPRWRADEHEVARWCRLLDESGIPADPRRLDLAPPGAAPASLVGATLVHPGAGWPARRWPPDRFAAVVRAELDTGRPVAVTAGPGEEDLARSVAEAGGGRGATVIADLALDRLAAAVAAAGRVVCGDTGIAHLATALRTPSVVLFGPVSPAHWGPPTDRPWHVALWAGRSGDPHGRAVDPGLLEIGIDDVVAALARLPRRPGPPTDRADPTPPIMMK